MNSKACKQIQLDAKTHKADTHSNHKRKWKIPVKIVDNESVDIVTSFWGPIETILLETVVKDILLERLSIEVIKKYNYTLSHRKSWKDTTHPLQWEKKRHMATAPQSDIISQLNNESSLQESQVSKAIIQESQASNAIIRKRIIMGINQVTKRLESATLLNTEKRGPNPHLVFMTNDFHPPTAVMHIPCLCRQLGIPILLMPGNRSSLELGQIMGTKSVSVIAFMPRLDSKDQEICTTQMESITALEDNCHSDIDSFIDFARTKVPRPTNYK